MVMPILRVHEILKSGVDILSAFSSGHPFLRLAADMISAHVDHVGDGAKSVVLILAGFLRALDRGGHLGSAAEKCRILAEIRNGEYIAR